jgi:hypothetical protein
LVAPNLSSDLGRNGSSDELIEHPRGTNGLGKEGRGERMCGGIGASMRRPFGLCGARGEEGVVQEIVVRQLGGRGWIRWVGPACKREKNRKKEKGR